MKEQDQRLTPESESYRLYKEGLNNLSTADGREVLYTAELRKFLSEGALHRYRGFVEIEALDHYPQPGERFGDPFFDVSTKLEETDRYLSWEEAQKISGLTDKEIEEMKKILLKVDEVITQVAGKAGLINEDGKIELACGSNKELMVVDVIGTLDECRFTYNGNAVSKEIARKFYRKTPWYEDVEKAKQGAKQKGVQNWKELCHSQPPPLDPDLKRVISQVYMSTANAFLEKRVFDSPDLKEVLLEYVAYLEGIPIRNCLPAYGGE